jgi:hypothetical protein
MSQFFLSEDARRDWMKHGLAQCHRLKGIREPLNAFGRLRFPLSFSSLDRGN